VNQGGRDVHAALPASAQAAHAGAGVAGEANVLDELRHPPAPVPGSGTRGDPAAAKLIHSPF
jgi:hypothetical protein